MRCFSSTESLKSGVRFILPAGLVIPFPGLCSRSFQKPSGTMPPHAIDARVVLYHWRSYRPSPGCFTPWLFWISTCLVTLEHSRACCSSTGVEKVVFWIQSWPTFLVGGHHTAGQVTALGFLLLHGL